MHQSFLFNLCPHFKLKYINILFLLKNKQTLDYELL